jgi:regulator of sigma E protease
MLLTIVAFVIVIGVLIFVHELGHFLAAKAVGVQVLRFSIGFGRPILSWTRGETEYRLAWVPLGGYVKMAGLEDEGVASDLEGGAGGTPVDPARAFDRKPVWARIVVLSAGVAMNVLLAFVIYTGIAATVGVPQLGTTDIDSVDVQGLPAGAEALGQVADRRILRINGEPVQSVDDIQERMLDTTVRELRFDVQGSAEPIVVTAPAGRDQRIAMARALSFRLPPRIGIVTPGQPAARAGLRGGDLVVRAQGDTVRSWTELYMLIRGNAGTSVTLDVQRGDSTRSITVVPIARTASDTAGGAKIGEGMMGAQPVPPRVYRPVGVGRAVGIAAAQTAGAAGAIVQFLGRLVSGDEPLRQLGGPVLIGQISAQVIRLGLHDFLNFLAFFSVQLAVLNLLPIPVLDGGHIVFLLIEQIRGRPIPVAVRIRLLNIGFWILIAIMVVALGNDVIFRLIPR